MASKKRPVRVMVAFAEQMGWGHRLRDVSGDVGIVDLATRDFGELGIVVEWGEPDGAGVYDVQVRSVPADLLAALSESQG